MVFAGLSLVGRFVGGDQTGEIVEGDGAFDARSTGGGAVFFLDSLVDFTTQDGNLGWEGKSELNGFASDFDHCDFDRVVDDDGLANLTCQKQHRVSACLAG